MKGLFIPEITTEMFRNGCLESIEALMAEGKIYDIDYQQSCEDAISRKAVLDKLNKLIEVERLQGTDEMGYGRERVSAYESMIFEIESKYLYPSVNPQQPCEDAVSRDCDKCAYYDDDANDEACDGCFADEYEHPNFKPKAQHCDDAVSRQAVDELSKELVHTTRDKADFLCNFWEGLQKLPSVTPKEKTGHWLHREDMDYLDENKVMHNHFMCKDCGFIHDFVDGHTAQYKYCPNCGAKMVEP